MNLPKSIYQLEDRKTSLKDNIDRKERLINENKNILQKNRYMIPKLRKEIRQIEEYIRLKDRENRKIIRDKNRLKRELNTIDKRYKRKIYGDRYWSKNNAGKAFNNIIKDVSD